MKTWLATGQDRPITLISGYRGLAETLIETLTQKQHCLSVLVRQAAQIPALQLKYPDHLFFSGSVENRSDVRGWIEATLSLWNRVDHLVNNAAITGPTGRLAEVDFTEFEQTLEVNFLAPIFLIHQLLPHFLRQGRGTVVNLSGGGATAPRPFFAAYGASKCALVRMTETLALEYPALSFYSVAPGALKTPMMEGISRIPFEKIGKEHSEAKERMEKGGDDPQKAADLIAWLCEAQPQSLSGKLISAKWDDYQKASKANAALPLWTLRRVDEALLKLLKE